MTCYEATCIAQCGAWSPRRTALSATFVLTGAA